jgi:hypothetical protein
MELGNRETAASVVPSAPAAGGRRTDRGQRAPRVTPVRIADGERRRGATSGQTKARDSIGRRSDSTRKPSDTPSDRYTPGVPEARRGGSDRGGPAIARSGRVVRPVRRPADRQTTRRRSGGDPREICNQVPRRGARDLLIHGAVGAHPAPRSNGTRVVDRQPGLPVLDGAPQAPIAKGTKLRGVARAFPSSLGAGPASMGPHDARHDAPGAAR